MTQLPQPLQLDSLTAFKSKFYEDYKDYDPIIKDMTLADHSRIWKLARKSCPCSEDVFKKALASGGVKRAIFDKDGNIIALFLSYITKSKGIYIPFVYHNGTIDGLKAMGFLCITTFLALPTKNIYFHSADNPFAAHSVWDEDVQAYRLTYMDGFFDGLA